MKALWWKHGFIYVFVFREVLIQTHMGPNIVHPHLLIYTGKQGNIYFHALQALIHLQL